ncbi:MAG: type II toxin-antitoxin system RelE/ParE family toxin [Rhodanobacteraceae bacterium]|nr:type II toxin-antitoxin system RelE/ParE family toxin [Rhodanobacteraceae bacterium]MBK7042834.1 type II toxin-antitoxin system RelE/ParE family toxin [Rhodanobacteraceae bacterium]MBP9154665.1 type II toxin-antitoxin system RelE/ParE family toxin [Xanthomonadales bacterium]
MRFRIFCRLTLSVIRYENDPGPLLHGYTHFVRNRLEALKGERSGQFSIRINDQYRIRSIWNGDDAEQVEIVDYH